MEATTTLIFQLHKHEKWQIPRPTPSRCALEIAQEMEERGDTKEELEDKMEEVEE